MLVSMSRFLDIYLVLYWKESPMSKIFRVAVLALAVSVLAAPAMAADPVVAKVNGKKIYRSDVARELQSMGGKVSQMNPKLVYPQLLEKLIVTKILSTKGYAQKLQKTKEVKARVKAVEAQIVADVYVRKAIEPKITDAMVNVKYKALSSKFKPEDEVRARHILVPTEKEAKALIEKIEDGEDFAKLASAKSKDVGSAKRGGDLGYFPRTAMVKPFAAAAFSMKAGEMSKKPVKTDFGYHIIKVEDRRKSSPPPLAQVKDQIKNQVGQELLADMVQDVKKKAKIERFNLDGTPAKLKKK